MGVQNWCHNYRWGPAAGNEEESCLVPPGLNIVFPAKTSLLSSSSCNMYHVEVGLMLCCYQMAVAKEFAIASFLAQCGDIESNPGPKAKKEAKPDPKKVMEDKVRVFQKLPLGIS